MGKLVKIILILLFVELNVYSQNIDLEVNKYIRMIESGEIDKAAEESANLISANPNHPGILYLQGRLSTDGIEALKFYQAIVDNFPKSEWADDALYKIYQYYYAVGLYRTAELKWKHLQKEYPQSPYLKSPLSKDIKSISDEIAVTSEQDTIKTQPPIKIIEQSVSIEPTPKQPEATQASVYTVQVGAFSTLENAKKQEKFFLDLGYEVELTNKIRAGKSLYLVWVGNFRSAEEAKKLKDEIKQKYKIESITVQKY